MGKRSDEKKAKLMLLLLQEYLKDSNRSDKKIAKALGVSQPTISKMKNRLLDEGLVSHFSAIPDFTKIGYEIMAFSFIKFNSEGISDFSMKYVTKIKKRAIAWAESNPCIIFDAMVAGMGIDAINISLHKDHVTYQEFLRDSKKSGET
jgi:DNA-binding Lrp family transcriptional regulator